jgi:hypothetical protein
MYAIIAPPVIEIFNDGGTGTGTGTGNGDVIVHDQCVFYLPLRMANSFGLKLIFVVLAVFFYLHRCAKAEGQQTLRSHGLLSHFVGFVLGLHPWRNA